MKKFNSLNAFLTILIIATSFFGIICPQDNPESLEDKFKQYSNAQTVDLINAAHLNTPIRRFIKTAKSDLNNPQFWTRSAAGTLISQFLFMFIFDELHKNSNAHLVTLGKFLRHHDTAILVDAALGSVFSIVPYLHEKNSLNSDNICHMANHTLVQLITPMLYFLHCKHESNVRKRHSRYDANLYSSLAKAFLSISADVTSAKNSNQS